MSDSACDSRAHGRNRAKQEQKLDVLPFPFRNAGIVQSTDPAEMLRLKLIGKGHSANQSSVLRPSSDFAIVTVGSINLVATRTTPCVSVAEDPRHITLALLYAGDRYRYQKEGSIQTIGPGDIHLCQRTGGIASIGYFSGIICEIDKSRLERTMKAMGVEAFRWNQPMSYVLQNNQRHQDPNPPQQRWSLFSSIDDLLGECSDLATGLGLDDQIYRLLALSLVQEERAPETAQRQWSNQKTGWSNPLDELVDYIRSKAHLHLTLTDLEEQSHYSGRHLQNLFHEKFGCTPMQFVRRQRLSAAMERLQTANDDDTVTTIARDCGYAYTSNFTTDFRQEFGVTPSVVLRSSRGRSWQRPMPIR